ncbi:MAG: hypothetical protein ABEL51_14790 [Salinibacter sp.]
MAYSWWLGVGLGIGVVGLHAAARGVTHHLAHQGADRHKFFVLELGGLGARMALAFVAVALVLQYVPVHTGAFVGTVVALFILSTIAEVRVLVRRMDRGVPES